MKITIEICPSRIGNKHHAAIKINDIDSIILDLGTDDDKAAFVNRITNQINQDLKKALGLQG